MPLRIRLLGGFRAERVDLGRPLCAWQRRSAKTLTKLLAVSPSHALHREEVMEILWPGLDLESALNGLGKALHAARRALEPELPPRKSSQYLQLTDCMLSINPERVVIDADHFQQLADDAQRSRTVTAYEAALAAYGGDLLPEDRYVDWCSERRQLLAELHVRLLLGLAEALEMDGAYSEAADRLRQAVEKDVTREDAHRRLIRAYAAMGDRDRALRQFHLCQDALRRELALTPQPETISLYQDLLQDRILTRTSDRPRESAGPRQKPASNWVDKKPLIGRERVIQHLCEQLTPVKTGRAGLILITGEPGVGKTRLLEEFANLGERTGALVLRGGSGAHAKHLSCGPFAIALEDYVASRPEPERHQMGLRYPALARCLPSLPITSEASRADPHEEVALAIARMLTELGGKQPVLLVLGDVQDLDPFNCDLLRYIAHLAVSRPWLIVGALREHEIETRGDLCQTILSMLREGLCSKLELERLTQEDCDELVRALLPDQCPTAELLEAVYVSSRGNPVFVEELVHELCQHTELVGECRRRSPVAAECPSARVPARLHALLATQLAGVEETVERVLALAAAAGSDEISLEELRGGAAALEPPISDAALFKALDHALHAGVLEEQERGYAFRYPLVRSALCEGLPHHRRAELDAAVGQARRNSRRLRVAAAR